MCKCIGNLLGCCVGYYLATLEAATQHIFDLADQYERSIDPRKIDASVDEIGDTLEEKLLL